MSLMDASILVVDDDKDIRFSLELLLRQHVKVVTTEGNPYQIPRLIRTKNPDIILLDMNFSKGQTSGEEGLHWLKKIKEIRPSIQVLMITAYSEVNKAVTALKWGAGDFIEKPWRNEKLLATLSQTIQLHKSMHEVKSLESQNTILNKTLDEPFSEMIGNSPQIKKIHSLISKVAVTDANVLILGENGTGKELIARGIHRNSKRAGQAFIPVDLGSISESLFESELFGHKRGSFTDAYKDRIGRFEAASNGSIFLDEIGNIHLNLQSKLLQVLETGIIVPVGSSQAVKINARIISASNMPLYEMVNDRNFRQDLLYRINTVEINVPPLRERKGDIKLLTKYFLDDYKIKYQKPELDISGDSIAKLLDYAWPGNVRELKHIIERSVILSENMMIQPDDIALKQQLIVERRSRNLKLEDVEKDTVLRALNLHEGNISKAAHELGITRASLYRRMEKFQIRN